MKKIIYLLTAVFVLSAVPVYAGCEFCRFKMSTYSEDWLAKKMEKMTGSLGLTEEQVPQMEALIKEKVEKKKAIFEESSGKIKAVKEEYSAKIQALLTDDQKVKYEEMKAEWKKGSMKGSGHDHKGSGSEMKGSDSEEKGSQKGS